MGCDCCKKYDAETDSCTASRQYRLRTCGEDYGRPGSNYTKPKKRRKKK